jgi:hypothetical protein
MFISCGTDKQILFIVSVKKQNHQTYFSFLKRFTNCAKRSVIHYLGGKTVKTFKVKIQIKL